MEWPAVLAPGELRVPLARLGQGGVAQHAHHRVVGRAQALQPVEALGQLDGRDPARPQEPPESGDGEEIDVRHAQRGGPAVHVCSLRSCR